MGSFLYRLGHACARRRRLTVLIWALLATAALGLGQAAGGDTSDAFDLPGTEAQAALDVLEADFPAAAGTSAQVVFAAPTGTLDDTDAAAAVDATLDRIAGQPHVTGIGPLQRSPDGTVAYAEVAYDRPAPDLDESVFARLEQVAEEAAADGAVRVELGGDLPNAALDDHPSGQELIGIAAAVLVLLVAFGSVIAMGLPIGLALVGLAASMGLIALLAAATEVNSVAPTIAAMIGLGVGIDYALFVVTRHRENLRRGLTPEEAAARATATAGAAVLFAGATVVIAICGLAIAGIPAITVMGLTAALTVTVMVALALTLLPALLGFAGTRIDALRLPRVSSSSGAPGRETFWHRWGRQVSAHPWRYLAAGLLSLGLLAAPVASMRLGMTDSGVNPTSMTTRRAYDLLAEGFGAGVNGPLLLAARLDGATPDDLAPLAAALADDPGVQAVGPLRTNEAATAAVLPVIPTTSPQDAATTDLVHRLRDRTIPEALAGIPGATVHVGGQTALFIDMSDQVAERLPWFIGAVTGLSLLLLTMVFRSIAVPLKAAAMNVLSIGAAYGVIVAVFQWGWLADLVGVEETVPIVSFMPMMLFAILFGLSMDYEVFLLSRVREEYLRRGDNDAAVVEGIAATARVITSAALIMISVFGAFVLGDDPVIKMFGLGLATAVLVDATVVRIVLVPATMRLLGDWNWWLPRWLDRLLPHVAVDGHDDTPAAAVAPGGAAAPAGVEPEPALTE